MHGMRIGELAQAGATPVETIRHYEREGLLAVPPRSAANYRLYGPEHLAQLHFIRHCRTLDMALAEIRVLLALRDQPEADCGDANAVIDAHLGHVEQRLGELRELRDQLVALRRRCAKPGAASECGILDRLGRDAAEPAHPPARRGRRACVPGSHG